MGQDRNIFDKVYKRCEFFLQENPQTYLKHFSIFKKVKTQLDTIPTYKFRHFYSLLFLLSSPVPKPLVLVPRPPLTNPNKVPIRSKTKRDWG